MGLRFPHSVFRRRHTEKAENVKTIHKYAWNVTAASYLKRTLMQQIPVFLAEIFPGQLLPPDVPAVWAKILFVLFSLFLGTSIARASTEGQRRKRKERFFPFCWRESAPLTFPMPNCFCRPIFFALQTSTKRRKRRRRRRGRIERIKDVISAIACTRIGDWFFQLMF